MKDIIEEVDGGVVKCNTAYEGARNTTAKHQKLMREHGWNKYYQVDIMDSEDDITLEIPNGKIIKKDYVGTHLNNYKSMLVLSHFKGHPMGDFGGALKQLSIGVASSSDKGKDHLIERIESRHGNHIIDAAANLKFGTKDYELINIDNI